MISLLDMLPTAWQALCRAAPGPGQGQLDALRSISIHAASERGSRLPSLAWMAPLLNLGQQSGPRLMAAWHTCMCKVPCRHCHIHECSNCFSRSDCRQLKFVWMVVGLGLL